MVSNFKGFAFIKYQTLYNDVKLTRVSFLKHHKIQNYVNLKIKKLIGTCYMYHVIINVYSKMYQHFIRLHNVNIYFQLVICAVFPPMPVFLKYNSKKGKKSADMNSRFVAKNLRTNFLIVELKYVV